ncbi:sporulation protein [Effusibacillus lacus]|uniref:Sporulation protein SpoOM n=1 Tax=Effusibacillus lacus TaxID=1348429 RepID=A0A292YE20_9BACL|nr:sporulation protein [Effusibacillus lacus]TCS72499.1 SpoOM protein [Effusibacillus lacus]GAX90932.1 hypothetical protein EFBL_2574 [Effusibacillus lacus]
MLNNSMAELGSDHPEIVLKLDRNLIPAGEMLTGSFMLWREIAERADNTIDVEFVLQAQLEDEVVEQKIEEFKSQPVRVSEDTQLVEFPFSYRLPQWLPVSTHAIRYYVRPKMYPSRISTHCVEDSLEMEAIIVQPNQEQMTLLKALSELGYHEKLDSRYWNGRVQEFDFVAGKENDSDVRELTVQFYQANGLVRTELRVEGRDPVPIDIHKEIDIAVSLRNALQIDI